MVPTTNIHPSTPPDLEPQPISLPSREQFTNILGVRFKGLPEDLPVYTVLTGYWSCSRPVYRVALGKFIPVTDRKVFPFDASIFPDCCNDLTGQAGFMDITFGREAAIRRPNRPEIDHTRLCSPLTILVIGVEPEYQGRGYGILFLDLAKQIAQAKSICKIYGADVLNHSMRTAMLKRGYVRNSRWSEVQLQLCIGLKPNITSSNFAASTLGSAPTDSGQAPAQESAQPPAPL